ncbi:MAG: winged helix-turn-helix transcriptional regulator [Firmicutes bacterium]|nr:winged helix-turn-helix transcriptional regulator [Bacillota bacterium]
MKRDIREIVESWAGVEEAIEEIMRREEKIAAARSEEMLLSGHQFDAMAVIAFLDIHNVTKIAKTIGCSKSAASIMISKMMADDMVKKTYGHNMQDNRSIYIEVTEKGKLQLKNFMRTRLTVIGNVFEKLNENLKKEVYDGMGCLCRVYNYKDSFLVETTNMLLDEMGYEGEKRDFIVRFSNFVANRLASEKTITENPQRISKNLTFQQLGMLKSIHIKKINTVSKLVKHFGTSVSTVSVNVSRLCRSGYVIKEYGKTDDNRETILSVTQKAKDELQAVSNRCFEIFYEEYNQMNPEQQKLLEDGLEHFDNVVKLIKAEASVI